MNPNKLRKHVLEMVYRAQSGHIGGSFSLAEVIAFLFNNFDVTGRDKIILSKGHAVPIIYAALHEKGIISKKELLTFREINSRLQGHPVHWLIPEVQATTGSLGQGLSIAVGHALAKKLKREKGLIFCIVGDGEMQEGQVWEVALSASHKKLNNLTLILDYNKGQIDGHVKDVLNLEPLKPKWEAFGWHVQVVDGHNFSELYSALNSTHPEKPTMIIANTVKGKGVSFMEDTNEWHGKAPKKEELDKALKEIQSKVIGL
jgi:transketolase